MVSRFLKEAVRKATGQLFPELSAVDFAVSPEKRFGDYTTNVAMVVAASLGKSPREISENIVGYLSKDKDFLIVVNKIEIAGPGFINFTLSDESIVKELGGLPAVLKSGLHDLAGEKINVEFISANPTGDLHIGHGRGGFYGDVLSNILSFAGAKVVREYYINDSRDSNQIKELGKTALGSGEQYKTEKTLAIIKESDFSGMSEDEAGFALAGKIQESNNSFVENKLGIKFNEWYSEDKKLRASGLGAKIIEKLESMGLVYEKEGAKWLKTSEYGDDEDRVIVRSDGSLSYFINDIAYHAEKFERGFHKVIDIWGADHHGHVKRLQATKKMLEWNGDFSVYITQLVSLKENGVSSKMSKRAGNVILLEDLVDEFGIDVVRWFFEEKALSTHMEFDMALAKEHSAKNPVFYVQYAHARINSIIEKAKEFSSDGSMIADVIKENSARALAVKLLDFPEVVFGISEDCQVHKLTTYVYELASAFSQFYDKVRIVGEENYNAGALSLARATKDTIAKSLDLLGISAPEKM